MRANPGWFYVGNGQLQYKDSDGWTDQYKTYRGPWNDIPDGEHHLVRSGRRESVAQREEASPENTSSCDCGLCGAAKTRRCTWMGLMGDRARRARFPQGAGPKGFPFVSVELRLIDDHWLDQLLTAGIGHSYADVSRWP